MSVQRKDGISWTDEEFFVLLRCRHSNGYVRIKIGQGHPMADKMGWALEHRVVVARSIGRILRAGEVVHHTDGNKSNNELSNLELLPDSFSHGVVHRKPGSAASRLPGEPNRLLRCACGCGTLIREFDKGNERHRFAYGHHQRIQPKPLRESIVCSLTSGPKTRRRLADESGTTVESVSSTLAKMRSAGMVHPLSRGTWSLQNG